MCFSEVSPLIRFELLALDASSAHKCAPHSVSAAEHPALLLLEFVLASSYPTSVVKDGQWARNAVVSATAGTRAGRFPHVRPLLLCTCAVVTRHGRPLLLPLFTLCTAYIVLTEGLHHATAGTVHRMTWARWMPLRMDGLPNLSLSPGARWMPQTAHRAWVNGTAGNS